VDERFEWAVAAEPTNRDVPVPPLPETRVYSRWRGSQVTFGPVGRLVMTVLMLVPMWWFSQAVVGAWPGLVIWGVFILPWGLRDIWRRTRIHAD